jgi:hypothetical protein
LRCFCVFGERFTQFLSQASTSTALTAVASQQLSLLLLLPTLLS